MGSRWYYNYKENFKCGLTLKVKYFTSKNKKRKSQPYTHTCRSKLGDRIFTPCWGIKVSEVLIEPIRLVTRYRAANIIIAQNEPDLEDESVNSQDLQEMEFEAPNFVDLNSPDNYPSVIKEEVINIKQEPDNALSLVEEEVIKVEPELGNTPPVVKDEFAPELIQFNPAEVIPSLTEPSLIQPFPAEVIPSLTEPSLIQPFSAEVIPSLTEPSLIQLNPAEVIPSLTEVVINFAVFSSDVVIFFFM